MSPDDQILAHQLRLIQRQFASVSEAFAFRGNDTLVGIRNDILLQMRRLVDSLGDVA